MDVLNEMEIEGLPVYAEPTNDGDTGEEQQVVAQDVEQPSDVLIISPTKSNKDRNRTTTHEDKTTDTTTTPTTTTTTTTTTTQQQQQVQEANLNTIKVDKVKLMELWKEVKGEKESIEYQYQQIEEQSKLLVSMEASLDLIKSRNRKLRDRNWRVAGLISNLLKMPPNSINTLRGKHHSISVDEDEPEPTGAEKEAVDKSRKRREKKKKKMEKEKKSQEQLEKELRKKFGIFDQQLDSTNTRRRHKQTPEIAELLQIPPTNRRKRIQQTYNSPQDGQQKKKQKQSDYSVSTTARQMNENPASTTASRSSNYVSDPDSQQGSVSDLIRSFQFPGAEQPNPILTAEIKAEDSLPVETEPDPLAMLKDEAPWDLNISTNPDVDSTLTQGDQGGVAQTQEALGDDRPPEPTIGTAIEDNFDADTSLPVMKEEDLEDGFDFGPTDTEENRPKISKDFVTLDAFDRDPPEKTTEVQPNPTGSQNIEGWSESIEDATVDALLGELLPTTTAHKDFTVNDLNPRRQTLDNRKLSLDHDHQSYSSRLSMAGRYEGRRDLRAARRNRIVPIISDNNTPPIATSRPKVHRIAGTGSNQKKCECENCQAYLRKSYSMPHNRMQVNKSAVTLPLSQRFQGTVVNKGQQNEIVLRRQRSMLESESRGTTHTPIRVGPQNPTRHRPLQRPVILPRTLTSLNQDPLLQSRIMREAPSTLTTKTAALRYICGVPKDSR